MIFHRTTMHIHHATACVDDKTGIVRNHPIIKSYKERGDLENRTRLTSVTDGVIHHLVITTVSGTLHVHDGFHITRLNLHEDGHTHLTVDFFQFIDDGMFGQILHPHIYRRDDVGTIDGVQHWDVHILIQDLPAMHQSVRTT